MSDDSITFKYKFDDLYQPQYANGCVGGINFKGEILLNFYTERMPIPNSETYKLNEDGTIGDKITSNPDQRIVVRTISSGVVMTKEQAKEFYEWLGKILEN